MTEQEKGLDMTAQEQEIERLKKELGRAYRAVRGFYSVLSKGQKPSGGQAKGGRSPVGW